MNAGPKLQLRLGQKLKLAPQLRQAIRLLQLNRLELKDHITELLESNPLLEQEESGTETDEEAPESTDSTEGKEEFEFDDSFEDWSDLPEGFSPAGPAENSLDQFAEDKSADSLIQHLLWQLNLSSFTETDEAIARAIIFALDDAGYLVDDLDTIRISLAPELLVSREEVAAVLRRIQSFEPVGVASRNLAECLAVQLQALPGHVPWRGLAERIVEQHLELLARQNLKALQHATGFAEQAVAGAVALIRSLDPRPGSRFGLDESNYIAPDVYIHPGPEGWHLTLNPENDPGLKLNDYYVSLIKKTSGEDAKYLKERLQEARWLIAGLELRNNTLVSVTRAILERQPDFLEHGEAGMRPLVQRQISEALDIHESTVSRATTQKYVHTPRGTFELKYFFSSSVPLANGEEISATAVKERIRKLIAEEPVGKPLSDQALADTLAETGILAARRTVAKYREQLGIPTSAARRRINRFSATA